MSIFTETNHLFLRNPHGGVEDIRAMRDAKFGAIFCNIGDFPPEEWTDIRRKSETAGVVCGPWLRTVETDDGPFSLKKFRHLIDVADEWETPFIDNSEKELDGTGDDLTTIIADGIGKRDGAVSMLAWPMDSVDWSPLRHIPVLPQINPAYSDPSTRPEDCRWQWHKRGVNCVIFSFGSWGMQTADRYDLYSPYGVYTADDCGQNYQAWSPHGTRDPCVNTLEELMEKIGAAHGVSAMADVLRKEFPNATGKPDPKNPSTWKAIDKFERTLLILVRDHDEKVK